MPAEAEGNAKEYHADTVLQLLHHVHWYHMRCCSILRQNDERMIYPAGFVADELENVVTPLVETLMEMMQQPHGPAEKCKGVFDGTGLKFGSGEVSNNGNGKGKGTGTGMWYPRPVEPTLDMEVARFGKDAALYGTGNGIGRGKGKGFAEGKGSGEIVGAGMYTGGSASSDKGKGKGNCKWGSKVAGYQPWQRKQ